MKRILLVLIALIIGFGAYAKSDYKNPVESDIVAELVIQPTESKYTVKRDIYLAIDKYDNHFISINVNYFKNKGKDDLQIVVDGSEYRLKLDKSIKVKAYSYYPENPTYRVTSTISTIGTHTVGRVTVSKEKMDYFEFFSIYPISKELYELIKEIGIDSIRVDGIYNIIIQ